MTWLLDTNACIRYLAGRAPRLMVRVDASVPADIVVCSVVKAELFFGAERSNNPTAARARQQQFLSAFVSLPFDDSAADHYGQIRAHLAARGTPIGPNDLLIAAIARSRGIT